MYIPLQKYPELYISFAVPWIQLFKHDAVDPLNPSGPIMFQSNDKALSLDPENEPSTVPLYSNLVQLKYLRNDDGEFQFKLFYPRTMENIQVSWQQSSNPVTDHTVIDFKLLFKRLSAPGTL